MPDDDDFTQETNIETRRKAMIEFFSNVLAVPYNQYDTRRNRNLLRAMLIPMLNTSLLGYEGKFDVFNQTGEEKETSAEDVYRIKRSFQDITLTDEQLEDVIRFAAAMRALANPSLDEIAKAIEKYITDDFFISTVAQGKKITYVLWVDLNVAKAIIYYKLLPNYPFALSQVICLPPWTRGCKLWLWGQVNRSTNKFYLPSIGAYWLYHKIAGSSTLYNPILILPDWILTIK